MREVRLLRALECCVCLCLGWQFFAGGERTSNGKGNRRSFGYAALRSG
ncbi:hypothetical protein HDF17_002048 [Granulicella arctica]|uniref:Uncharacterized protein n=1 Tax=Granulicella arctica TaxID=940613 RepID=A0A7Y9PIH7_9BACT|nr:hypothetical protein [Granulicella arctica]